MIVEPQLPQALWPVGKISEVHPGAGDRVRPKMQTRLLRCSFLDVFFSYFRLDTIFRVRNQTAVTPNSDVVNEVTPDLQGVFGGNHSSSVSNRMMIQTAEIQSPVGFLYVILPVILNQSLSVDCEQSWYLQTHFSREIMFRVRNQTAVTPNSDVVNEVTPDRQHSDHFWWLLAVFIIVLLIIILICLMKRKRIFRIQAYWSKAVAQLNNIFGLDLELDPLSRLLGFPFSHECQKLVFLLLNEGLINNKTPTHYYKSSSLSFCMFRLDTIFRVRNQTAVTPNSVNNKTPISQQFIFIILHVQTRHHLQSEESNCSDSKLRDLATVGSTDPGISSANQFSESAQ
ncbi:hypothetical protein ROHU_025893 [Labeo rohita]|uniref:Uncharacterized protein n=1 Tax=Labeo rohita TaxID=84645 RepID=A0A498MGB6_LABRO|nr:hypothetical protein ROHU_025893 [Labeo rohita]